MISVIMVQHNHPELTARALESLHQHHAGGFEALVVDNGSTEPGTQAATEALSGCTVIFNPVNPGFGAGNNMGARAAHGEILLFLNNDTIVHAETLSMVESYFSRTPACGAAGLRLLNTDGSVQYSTGKYPTIITEWRMKRREDLYDGDDTPLRDWVSGAALAVRTAVFEEVGGFDERYFMYFEDVDLCARIRGAGHEIHYLPSTRVEHLGGGSQPGGLPPEIQKEYRRSQLLFYRAHASIVNNILLRAYLIARFVPRRFSPDRDERSLASSVLSLVFTPRDEHRH